MRKLKCNIRFARKKFRSSKSLQLCYENINSLLHILLKHKRKIQINLLASISSVYVFSW